MKAVGLQTSTSQLLSKRHGKEHVGSLGLAIGGPGFVSLAILVKLAWFKAKDYSTYAEVRVRKPDGTEAVAAARDVYNSR